MSTSARGGEKGNQVSISQLKRNALAIGLAAALAGCGTSGRPGYVPPEALSPPAAQLADGILKFGVDVKKDSAADYRRKVREDLIRIAVITYVHGDLGQKSFEGATPQPVDLLCEPNYSYARVIVPIENTVAKSTAIKELLNPPAEGWKPLLKALGTTYTVKVDSTEVVADYDKWLTTPDGTACADLAKTADSHVTRDYIGREFALASGLAAAKTLWDSIWGIVKPAVEGALTNADLERRNEALRRYFSNPQNVEALKRDLKSTEDFIDREFKLARTKTAGLAVVAQAHLFDFGSAHWKQVVSDAASCKQALRARSTNKTHLAGVRCLDKVFSTLSPAVNEALDAADKFDESLAKQLPPTEKRLSAQVETVAAIARGEIPDDDRTKALWAAVVRYATLYNTVKDVGSDDNRKKLDDALKAFREALK